MASPYHDDSTACQPSQNANDSNRGSHHDLSTHSLYKLLNHDIPTPSSALSSYAKSSICEECGMRFGDPEVAKYHLAKTGHESLAESKEETRRMTKEEGKIAWRS